MKLGEEVIVRNRWYVIDEICNDEDMVWCMDEDGGLYQFCIQEIIRTE